MIQLKIIQAYDATQEIIQKNDLSINAKWALFKLRKELISTYEFYVNESKELFSKYKTTVKDKTIIFESPEFATEYQTKQDEIDNFEVEISISSYKLKLSDIPNITVSQIELLDGFIEFVPE